MLVAAVGLSLSACRSGPTLDDAESLLAKGEPEAALEAARSAAAREHEPAALVRARRVAFESGLALGRSDEAARDLQELDAPPGERDRLLERLAGTALLAALSSPDAGRRAMAAGDLVLVAPHPKLSRLVDRALADREPGVRVAALPAAARLADAGAAASRLARLVSDDPSPEVREAAAQVLAQRLGSAPSASQADASELARARAVLARHAERVAPPATFSLASAEGDVAAALESCDYEVRLAGVRAVAERLRAGKGAAWRGRLVQRLDDPAEPVRTAAVDALGIERDALPVLAEVTLSHSDAATRRRAFLSLDRAAPLSVAELSARLAGHDPAIAPEAARLLGERGGTAAVAPLVSLLADTRAADRPAVARALGVVGGLDASAALVKALDARDPALRRAAAEGLARAGGSAVRDDLLRALERTDGDADVAAAAALLATFAHPAGAGSSVQESP